MGMKIKENVGLKPELRESLVQPKQVNSLGTDLATLTADFNTLLAKLRTAGIIDS